MERLKLNVSERVDLGTTKAVRLRGTGIVPGIVYGKGRKNMPVSAALKDVKRVKGGHIAENVLIDLIIKAENSEEIKKTVLVKEIQKDALKGDWLHIDFNEISLKEKLKTKVPVELQGDAKGITQGGVLEHIMHELEIECLPQDIPHSIKLDVTNLEIGHTLYVKDIPAHDKIVILTNIELPVAAVVVPKAEEEAVPAAAEGETAEPEVIKKGKKEEEGVEGEAAPAEKKEEKAEKKPAKEEPVEKDKKEKK